MFGFHEFQGARNYQYNYSTQTLSSNFSHVAGINKPRNEAYITKNRSQTISILSK